MEANAQEPTCESRIDEELKHELQELGRLWHQYCRGKVDEPEIYDYGLSFDYVPPGTFEDQKEGYFRYQISWGGPSDEFRFYVNPDFGAHRIEYWFLDWWDGAWRVLDGRNYELLAEIYEGLFRESGTCKVKFNEAMQE